MAYRSIPERSDPRLIVSIPDQDGQTYRPLTVDSTTPVQSNFLGISAVNMAFMEFPEYGLTTPQKTAEYDRVYLSGLRMARTAVKTDWAMPTFPAGAADWSSAKMGYLYAFLAAMQSRGINVVLTMGWHFPGSVCDLDLNGVIPSCVPGASDENAWKAWVSELLNQTINVRGYTNIVACFFFTEPNNAVANPAATDAKIPSPYTAGQYYGRLVTLARAQIISDDASRTPILPRVKLIGSEEHSFSNDTWTEYILADSPTAYDALAAHSYEDTPDFPPLSLTASNSPSFATYLSRWQNWKSDAAGGGKQIWSDEFNALVTAGGDADTTGYRRTADAGMRICRGLIAQMKAGVAAAFIWTFRDERFENSGGYTQQYGIEDWPPSTAVRPSWYSVTMMANLCGGGTGTKVFDGVTGETTTLHGVGVFIPSGDRWSTSASGDWSIAIVNESTATGIRINLSTSLAGRTVYRYTYSGETPPKTASDPAYLLPWDARYTGVTTQIPNNIVAGRSVVVYSTIPLHTTTTENLALRAGVSTDSTGFGNPWNVVNGNFSNVIATVNTWRKADNSSHYVQLSWPDVKTIGRVEIAFAGTTTGVVYATYVDATSPTVLADYVLSYLNASGVWTTLATVSGNTSPNKTHTFTAVQTSGLRLTVTSAAASANVNQIGAYAS